MIPVTAFFLQRSLSSLLGSRDKAKRGREGNPERNLFRAAPPARREQQPPCRGGGGGGGHTV